MGKFGGKEGMGGMFGGMGGMPGGMPGGMGGMPGGKPGGTGGMPGGMGGMPGGMGGGPKMADIDMAALEPHANQLANFILGPFALAFFVLALMGWAGCESFKQLFKSSTW